MKPDIKTVERLSNLAVVGTLLRQAYSEENLDFGTDYFMARDSLNKFSEGLKDLDLDEKTKQGMNDLVSYLNEKLDKKERGDFA